MTDQILIRQLKAHTIIGIHDWEKQNKQTVLFDLDLSFDCSEAAQTDDIKHALDYFHVCSSVTDFVEQNHYELIETLAENVAQLILTNYPCEKVCLTLYKPAAIKNTQTVGIKITRKP